VPTVKGLEHKMLRVMGLERKNVESLGFKFAEGLAVMGP